MRLAGGTAVDPHRKITPNPGSRTRYNLLPMINTLKIVIISAALAAAAAVLPATAAEIPVREAEEFGKLLVQTPAGRICPMNTYSSELLRKIYHSTNFRGQTPDESLLRTLSDPSVGEMPLIYVSDKSLRRRFGAAGEHIAYARLFDGAGNYLLGPEMEGIYAKAPAERNKSDKELIKLDEKANILYALFNGGMLSVFPSEGGWLSAGDDLGGLTGQDSLLAANAIPWYVGALREGDIAEAAQVREMIAAGQRSKVPEAAISESRVKAELLYNKAGIFRWAFRAYLILGAVLLFAVFTGKGSGAGNLKKILVALIFAVFLWQSFGMGLRWYISGRAPWTNSYETMVYVGWTTVLAGMIFSRRAPLTLALGTLMGGVILFVSNLSWLDPQITPLVPVLRSPWLMIHVSVITASYGFFGICAVAGITSMAMLLFGRVNHDLRRVNEMSMIIGLVLLTIGIFFGAIWANESWGRYWGWDPKETWALITMIVYALITHSRFIPSLNNYFAFSAMSSAAILSVLMTFFGVNYYLSGLHSYGNSGAVSSVWVIGIIFALALLTLSAGIKYRKLAKENMN